MNVELFSRETIPGVKAENEHPITVALVFIRRSVELFHEQEDRVEESMGECSSVLCV